MQLRFKWIYPSEPADHNGLMQLIRRPLAHQFLDDFSSAGATGRDVTIEDGKVVGIHVKPDLGQGSGRLRRGVSADFCGVINQWATFRMRPILVLDANPGHIGAHFFANHNTFRGALDRWASVLRDLSDTPLPLTYQCRRNLNRGSQLIDRASIT